MMTQARPSQMLPPHGSTVVRGGGATMIASKALLDPPAGVLLRIYRCPGARDNGTLCGIPLLEADPGAPTVVRKRCKRCDSWVLLVIEPE